MTESLSERIISACEMAFPDKKPVLGEGSPNARLMLIGEAPGSEEERLGRPFVGKAGKNLDSFLEMTGLDRKELYITNTVKIRPARQSGKTGKPVNRPPNACELEFFIPFLMEEIGIVSPWLIVTLGNTPLRAVTGNSGASIGGVHGKLISVGDRRLFPLYHPAAVIYNRSLEEIYIEDLRKLRKVL